MNSGRITSRSMSDSALRGLQSALGRSQKLQNELSSGRRVSRPGDDPTATAASMKLRSQRRANEQYIRNIDDAAGRLNMADNALGQLADRIRRAQELVTTAGNGSISETGRAAASAELRAIREEVIDLYNTRWLGRPVFGGTVSGELAVGSGGTFVGNDGVISSRISRDGTVRTDVKGSDAGADELPGLLETLANDAASGSNTGPNLTSLKGALDKVLATMGDVGARTGRLQSTRDRVDAERLDFTSRISENEDVDLPQTIMNLQSQQVAYQAALGAASKVLQVSLVDFLR